MLREDRVPWSRWARHHLLVGVLLGMTLGTLGRAMVVLFSSTRLDGDAAGTLAVSVLVVLSAAAVFGCIAPLVATSSLWLLRMRGAAAAAWLSASLLLPALMLHGALVSARVLMGAFPSLAPLQMLWSSPSQFLHAGMLGNELVAVAVVVVSMLVAVGLQRVLRRVPPPSRRYTRALRVSWLVLAAGMASSALAISVPEGPLLRRLRASAPEVVLLASLDESTGGWAGGGDTLGLIVGPPLERAAERSRRARASSGSHPNVMLIMLESVSFDHVGYAGYGRPVTPHLDALARRSLRFERVWSASTQSNYAQMAILSALLPLRVPYLDTFRRLDYPRALLHDVLHQAGYATATVSSQNEHWQGMRRFQDTGTPTFFRHSLDHRGPHIGEGDERKLPDHLTVDVLVEWLQRPRDRPWGVYLNFQRTHFPYQLPEGFAPKFTPADPDPARFSFLHYPSSQRDRVVNRYDSALRYVDAQIGRVIAYLREQGVLDDTLVVVTADHGEMFGARGLVTHGNSVFDGQARVPLLLHWPGGLTPEVRTTPVSTIDIVPSILDLLGLPAHPAHQGISFIADPAYRAQRRAHYITLQAARKADAVTCWPYKLIMDWTDSRVLLYDLARDPGETEDLSEARPAVRERLLTILKAQRRAQLRYHDSDNPLKRHYHAPRLYPCP